MPDQNELPTECGQRFTVNASGSTREEAKENAQASASSVCRSLKKGCNQAFEVGEGSFLERNDDIVYTSEYVCAEV